MPSNLTIRVPADFELKRAVCSYGYFLLAPNLWLPDQQKLLRPLTLGGRIVGVGVTQPGGRGAPLRVACDTKLPRADQAAVRAALVRMLRPDEDLAAWNRLNPAARRRGFGRMFRSPTLFEDLVKTITGCNVTWRNTMSMNRHLTAKVGRGAFPTPAQLARLTPSRLKQSCRVGYRAARIINLARAFERGAVDPDWFESPARETAELREALLRLEGFGPYAAANMLQLLGHYDHLPIDTETYRHYCHVTGVERPKNDKLLDPLIHERYDPLAPYQFLAYWFEIWRDYERRYGDAWTWDPATTGANFTAAVLNK
ncbi:hypothetical protein KOR34_46230 [Posidoniimonas corsicana]|uniref:DNA-(apurinic or apyrimidinic site) lyase n=1 Tax=Posidoniimonas corsicana TaxID=1938618 RepID=A0A5C5V0E5_9BACT|nr:hypothetical protein [Posidoniimonas corsicana]TWT31247.1 hypothetical protein KOR34_46230 [Posidoniimonas corsicana]